MREWLSGGAPPCQGGGRGFESRLALLFLPEMNHLRFFYLSQEDSHLFQVASDSKFVSVGVQSPTETKKREDAQ